jgi:D-cysteine desulfhydrase
MKLKGRYSNKLLKNQRLPSFSLAQKRFAQNYPQCAASFSSLSLGSFPTPVQRLSSLEKEASLPPLYVKRDDLSAPYYGGNKVRKLEFYLAQALAKKAKRVLALGAVGSNHIAAVGYYAKQLGLRCSALCFPQPPSPHVRQNLYFNLANQVSLHPLPSPALLPLALLPFFCFQEKSYLIPLGGTSTLGVYAYVLAAFELVAQIEAGVLPCPHRIYCALGTTGTCAGLLLGFFLAGYHQIQICPVSVVQKPFCGSTPLVFYANHCNRALRHKDPQIPYAGFKSSHLTVIENQLGKGYGHPTPSALSAQELLAEKEGIFLEGTYTAKAFAALLAQETHAKKPILFWNTINSRPLFSEEKTEKTQNLKKTLEEKKLHPLLAPYGILE